MFSKNIKIKKTPHFVAQRANRAPWIFQRASFTTGYASCFRTPHAFRWAMLEAQIHPSYTLFSPPSWSDRHAQPCSADAGVEKRIFNLTAAWFRKQCGTNQGGSPWRQERCLFVAGFAAHFMFRVAFKLHLM